MSFTFLLIYGAMWALDIRFDTRFFAIAYSLLGHTELFFMDWFTEAIRSMARFITSAKRIQVDYSIEYPSHTLFSSPFQTFLLLEESQQDQRLLSVSDKQLFSTTSALLTPLPHLSKHPVHGQQHSIPDLKCHLQEARWQQVHSPFFFFFFCHVDISPTQHGSFTLKNILFDAHPGDLICIIGPVGSGKVSTTFSLADDRSLDRCRALSCKHSLARSPSSMAKCDCVAPSAMCHKSLVSHSRSAMIVH